MRKAAFFVVFFLSTVVFAGAAEQRPNIVFIFTDDHAYQTIGAYGSNRNETPNMDKLAAEGIRFTNCCVTNSICGPCRAVIQTGKYSHINGFKTNNDTFDNTQQTFPKLLQKAGYQTAIVGKWHLVSEVTGFDYSEVLVGQGPYYNPPMIRNGERVKHTGRTTEIITGLSLDWLKNRDKNKPFLLMTQHKAPHREWDAYPEYYAKYKDRVFLYPKTFNDNYANRTQAVLEQDMTIAETLTPIDLKLKTPNIWNTMTDEQKAEWRGMYSGRQAEFEKVKDDPAALKQWKYQCYMKDYLSCIAAVDDSIGKLVKYLEDEKLLDNTIVVYASDQGFYTGEHGWFDKRFMYNESFKTPLLVRWAGKVKPGTVNNDIVSNVDLAETFLEAAGVPVPADMQGRSLVPILQGNKPADWRTSLYYHYYEYPAVHYVKKHEGIYDGRFKLIHYYDDIDEWELIDLQTDPDELRNVIADPKYAADIERLKKELERQKTVLKVPPLEVNTKNILYDKEEQEKRPQLKPQIERLRKIVEERKKRI
ncbi:MAG: sulfatase [Planctomycetaceae bacterium]|jgi:arylsulfatase A-like enzyme|nr:sulfatase [Planctomycetaceae bacterium]